MSFLGYLVKVGTYTVPADFIEAESFLAKINSQDLNSYTDANGKTHRNALENVKPVITWTVPAPITEAVLRPLLNGIQNNYISGAEKERKCSVTAFYPEVGRNLTFDMYMSDPEIMIDKASFKPNGELTYKKVNIKFTAYGGKIQ